MAPNAPNPIITARTCARINAISCDISCSKPPYMNQFIIVLYYLVVFQYDHDLPSYDHSGVFSLLEPLHNRYIIYTFPSIYMTSNERKNPPTMSCNSGLSMIYRLICHPIIGNLRHLLETFQRLESLSICVSY